MQLAHFKYTQLVYNFSSIDDELILQVYKENDRKYIYSAFLPSIYRKPVNESFEFIKKYFTNLFLKINTQLKLYTQNELEILINYILINYFLQFFEGKIQSFSKECLKYLDITISDDFLNFLKEEILFQILRNFAYFEEYYSNGTIEKLINYLDPITEKHNQFDPYQIKT